MEGRPEQLVVHTVMLRSLQHARYDAQPGRLAVQFLILLHQSAAPGPDSSSSALRTMVADSYPINIKRSWSS